MIKVMILGAGIYQVPLIKKSKELGYYTIVISYKGNYPGFKFADKVYYEDTTNIAKILEIARNENIDAIVTTGTDVAILTLGKINDELGLCGLSHTAAKLSTNKLDMKEAFLSGGVRTANYEKVSKLSEAIDAFNKFQKPVIFKVVDSSGSRGIIKVSDESTIPSIYRKISKITKEDYIIVEEYLTGEEFGAQAFVFDKEIKFIMPHGDMVFKGDAGVPIGHYVPYITREEVLEDVKLQLENAVKALKLDNCGINADFILCNGKVFVLEIGARVGATCLAEMVSIHYGIDYYKYILDAALSNELETIGEPEKACIAELLLASKDGIIKRISYEGEQYECIFDLSFDYFEGDRVRKFQVGPDRIGQIVLEGESLNQLNDFLIKIKRNLVLEISD
ncbi:MAG: ATP-grasp domain-containing protein [Saprospiraceae bacterium]|nr:ATP-grasp domain-containing protein [Saprospiraceae bacterium]